MSTEFFSYRAGTLHAGQVSLADVAAKVGTPCYVYSRAAIEQNWRAFDKAFGGYPHRICYSVKANGNLGVLSLLARLGSGFDIVSGGELRRVIAAGGAPEKIIFSGVGKQDWEIDEALAAGIACFNIESESELQRIGKLAAARKCIAPVSVRLNPDVDAKTHPYISTGLRTNKFGIDSKRALEVYARASRDANLRIRGIACHIGSQLTDLAPYRDALARVLDFAEELHARGIEIDHIDFGGGLGVRYENETPPSAAEYCGAIVDAMRARKKNLAVTIEPGRAIAANAGVLLTRVICIKRGAASNFCVVDAGMNDLLRPSLYRAHHDIIEVEQNPAHAESEYEVVGPVCESGDFLGKTRRLKTAESELLAVCTAGAYGAVMASNYNTRARPAEVIVDAGAFHIARAREEVDALFCGERVLAE